MRARSKLFKRSHAIVRHLPAWASAPHSLFWMHALAASDLNDITVDYYTGEGGTAFGSQDHNLVGLWDWEKAAIEESFAGCKSVLVAASGGGRELIALAKMGFEVSGFDASEGLMRDCAEHLRTAGVAAELKYAPPGGVPVGSKIHDALVIGRGAYHHIPGRQDRIRFLTNCRKQIKANSPVFVGDFLTRTENGHRFSAFSLSGKIERGDSASYSFYHYFTRGEIEFELHAAGFEKVKFRVTAFPVGEGKMAHALARSKPSD